MNIAMISYHTCPLATLGGKDTGGMNVYVREVTHYLGRRGVHVDVFTRSQDEHVPHVLHDLGHGNRVVHIPAGPEVPLPKQELVNYLPKFVEGIQKFACDKGIHYDLIYSHYWLSGIAAESLKQDWNIPVVHMFHTLSLMKNRIAQSPEEMEGEYRTNGERRVLQMADRIIAPTLAEQAQLYFLYQADVSKIDIIPPGVDIDHFYPIPPDEAREAINLPVDERMLLFVGRIEPLKGLDTLLRAIATMREAGIQSQVPHYLAVVGGDPSATGENLSSEMVRLQTLCSELGLNDMVLFLGKRDQASLPYYYSAADVLIMPSHYESFGMVALEAMACGTPVVASKVGGLAFLVVDGETGFVVPDNDPIALGEKLTLLLTNPALREQLGQQAAAYARHYAWENIVARLINTFDAVLSKY
jgi:D-inositol-3-phosphate glycosyltransferase